MKTSYFAKSKNHPNAVAITSGKPRWFKGKYYSKLGPPVQLVKDLKSGKINREEYTKRYLECIRERNLTQAEVLSDLGNDAILLCYEGSGKFCHRHIAAKWLREGGIEIAELEEEEDEDGFIP